MKYLLLLASDPSDDPTGELVPGSPEFASMIQEWTAYTTALTEAGALLGGEALQGVETATSIQVRDGQQIVTDGPFIEAKEVLGGYYLIEAADLDEAIGWAARVPSAVYGTVEIRPIMEFDGE